MKTLLHCKHILESSSLFSGSSLAHTSKDVRHSFTFSGWDSAFESTEVCLEYWPSDGPTLVLQNYMSLFNFIAPDTWNGYRNIDETIEMSPNAEQYEEEEEKEQIN